MLNASPRAGTLLKHILLTKSSLLMTFLQQLIQNLFGIYDLNLETTKIMFLNHAHQMQRVLMSHLQNSRDGGRW